MKRFGEPTDRGVTDQVTQPQPVLGGIEEADLEPVDWLNSQPDAVALGIKSEFAHRRDEAVALGVGWRLAVQTHGREEPAGEHRRPDRPADGQTIAQERRPDLPLILLL